jgi:hypothetical protein
MSPWLLRHAPAIQSHPIAVSHHHDEEAANCGPLSGSESQVPKTLTREFQDIADQLRFLASPLAALR